MNMVDFHELLLTAIKPNAVKVSRAEDLKYFCLSNVKHGQRMSVFRWYTKKKRICAREPIEIKHHPGKVLKFSVATSLSVEESNINKNSSNLFAE